MKRISDPKSEVVSKSRPTAIGSHRKKKESFKVIFNNISSFLNLIKNIGPQVSPLNAFHQMSTLQHTHTECM